MEIKVYKTKNEIYWYKKENDINVIYLRRENSTTIASPYEIIELILSSTKKDFDKTKTSFIFNINKFKHLNNEFKKRNDGETSLTRKELESKGIVTEDGYLTNAGYLFLDDTPYINANITCRKWNGINKGDSEIIQREFYQSDLINLFNKSRDFINAYNKKGLIKIEEGGRKNTYSYPLKAIDEALINAIVHRDYTIYGSQIDIDIFNNRIEITSPGSFPFDKEAQEYDLLEIPSKRRNEYICNIFEICNLMERSGTGLSKIKEEYEMFDEQYQPKIYSNGDFFRITLFDLKYKKEDEVLSNFIYKKLDIGVRKYDEKIFEYCKGIKRKSNEIQSYLKLKDKKYFQKEILSPLVNEKYLLQSEKDKRSPLQKYYLNTKKVKEIKNNEK